MKKRLVWIFVILVVGLFVISACERYVGRNVNNKENVGLISTNIDIKVKDEQKNIIFNRDSKTLFINNVPIKSFGIYQENLEKQINTERSQNFFTGFPVLDWFRIRTAVANDVPYYRNRTISNFGRQGEEVLYMKDAVSRSPNINLPLITNGRVTYRQGRELIHRIDTFTEDVARLVPGINEADTLRYKLYYFEDLPEYRPLNDEDVIRMNNALYERLGQLGNDMNYEDVLVTMIFSYAYRDFDNEIFKRWFVSYDQYFDDDGRPINRLSKSIFALTVSEELLYTQFNDQNNPNWWVVDGYSGLTGSRNVGRNMELQYKGILFGNAEIRNIQGEFWPNMIKLRPNLKIINLYQRGGGQPARRLRSD